MGRENASLATLARLTRLNNYGSSPAMLSGLTKKRKRKKEVVFIILINNEPILTSTLAAGIVLDAFA